MAKQWPFGYNGMITPELKYIHSPDILDLEDHVILRGEPFYVLIQAMFGMENEMGQESFDFMLCNPKWLAEETKYNVKSGRHLIIAEKFNLGELRRFLEKLAKACAGKNWDEVGNRLGRFGHWEFEDYNEFVDPSSLTENQIHKDILTPELRFIQSPEVLDIKSLVITRHEAICIPIQAIFGIKGGSDEKCFNFVLCNIAHLIEKVKHGPISEPNFIIVEEFDIVELRDFFENLAKFSVDESWEKVCKKIGRFGT
jgi:hypothetical protein